MREKIEDMFVWYKCVAWKRRAVLISEAILGTVCGGFILLLKSEDMGAVSCNGIDQNTSAVWWNRHIGWAIYFLSPVLWVNLKQSNEINSLIHQAIIQLN